MDKPLYLFVGPSGCGKTTITHLLEERYKEKSIRSYTTREPRYEGEDGHIFISDEEFRSLTDLVAYTKYNGFKYGTTASQLDEATLYVVDIPGVGTLFENYKNTKRQICVFYLDSSVRTRIKRMLERGDSDTAIVGRLYNDEEFDWYRQLERLVWHYKNNEQRNVELYKIDANENIENVLEQVLYYIKQNNVLE